MKKIPIESSSRHRGRISPRMIFGILAVLFIVSFVMRMEYGRRNGFFQFQKDGATENIRVAMSLARGEGFAGPFPHTEGMPSAHVSPIYPFLLSILYRVLGSPPSFAGYIGQVVFSILLTLINALLAYAVILKIFRQPPLAALIGSGFMMLNPYFFWFETYGAHETVLLAILLQLLLMLTVTVHREQWKRRRTLVWLALISGISALTTPAFLLYVALFLSAELFFHYRRLDVWIKIGLTVIVTGLILLPWGLRNQHKLGGFIISRSNLGLELYIGNNAWATGETYSNKFIGKFTVFGFLHPFTNPEEQKKYRELGEYRYMDSKKKLAVGWIRSNLGGFLWLSVKRAVLYWLPLRTQSLYELSKSIYNWILLVLFALYGFRAVRDKQEEAVAAIAIVFCVFLPYLITHIDMRYKYPIIPVLIAGSACQILYWLGRSTPPKTSPGPGLQPRQG